MAAKFRKGDKVVVLTGKDKGKEGVILSVDPKSKKAVVDGIWPYGIQSRAKVLKGAGFRGQCQYIFQTFQV